MLGGCKGRWAGVVQSGLVDDPRILQFPLTAHLGLAFAILGAMLRAWLLAVVVPAPPRAIA